MVTDTFAAPEAWKVGHGACRKADVMLIAPATANVIGKVAGGIADDMLDYHDYGFQGESGIRAGP